MQDKLVYPQYRKYPHGRTYFKVISPDEWEEIHIMGNKYTIHQFKATILPDRNYIYDLTFGYEAHWLKIDAEEYETIRSKAI